MSSAVALSAIAASAFGIANSIVEQELQHRTQRIDVRARTDRSHVATCLLRRHVSGSAENHAMRGVRARRRLMSPVVRSIAPDLGRLGRGFRMQ